MAGIGVCGLLGPGINGAGVKEQGFFGGGAGVTRPEVCVETQSSHTLPPPAL